MIPLTSATFNTKDLIWVEYYFKLRINFSVGIVSPLGDDEKRSFCHTLTETL
jgi:hypothetical protein